MPMRARDLVALGLDGNRLGVPLPSPGRRRKVDEMLDAVDATSSPINGSAACPAASSNGCCSRTP